jgi:beta-mannosidase
VRLTLPHHSIAVDREWTWCRTAANTIDKPGPELAALPFEPAQVPGTIGAELAARGQLNLSSPPDLDGSDYWYRCRLPRAQGAGEIVLVFEGLASMAEVWIDDEQVLSTDNMYRRYEINVTDALLQAERVLSVRFRALSPLLAAARRRPRWRPRLVAHQQLRWLRTTLIGRTPGFCPRVPPVGPFRAVRLEQRAHSPALRLDWQTAVQLDGRVRLDVALHFEGSRGVLPSAAVLELSGDAVTHSSELSLSAGPEPRAQARLELDGVALWWPHTHGEQPLSRARIHLEYPDGAICVELGRVGFRKLESDPSARGLSLLVNGVPIFCRGACWTVDDLISLGEARDPRETLELARTAGMNMLRVGGTTSYESDRFYDCCDELGILVWQDFMFASMDYPAGDAAFLATVSEEARQLLARLQGRPCLAVLAGGSEVEQQAAMTGLSPAHWKSELFYDVLPALATRFVPEVPYVPSTPTGGGLPFHANARVSHYYGVGAYLRPFPDARTSDVAFAAECLAFSNVPEESTIQAFLDELETPPHHPRWKERVPRDRGVGWDFEDIRDHYLRVLFDVDPLALRYSDVERYLALGRVTSGEVMQRVFTEWRRSGSSCHGGLVWFLKDFWPGAGFGVIDSLGVPKAAYYALARVFAPVALLVTDEGLNGFALHAINETAQPLALELEVVLFRDGKVPVGSANAPLALAPRSRSSISVDALLGAFRDTTYAYRFGPPACDLLVARMKRQSDGTILGRAFGFPLGLPHEPREDIGLKAQLEIESAPALRVSTERFAAFVSLDVPGFRPSDNYFHLAPGEQLTLSLLASPTAGAPRARVTALNATTSCSVTPNKKP